MIPQAEQNLGEVYFGEHNSLDDFMTAVRKAIEYKLGCVKYNKIRLEIDYAPCEDLKKYLCLIITRDENDKERKRRIEQEKYKEKLEREQLKTLKKKYEQVKKENTNSQYG